MNRINIPKSDKSFSIFPSFSPSFPTEETKVSIDVNNSIVIVGANGSGKTRFGSAIESINNPSKRIAAQRYLQLSNTFPKKDFNEAESHLRSNYKNQPPIQPQTDFEATIIAVFAEESSVHKNYYEESKLSTVKIEPIPTIKDQLIEVWDFVFPHRKLNIDNYQIKAVGNTNEFYGNEMSDGEKVGLYLIAQVLLAEQGCFLIIDEPEIHLHKALMVRLWNKLEEKRKDCTFVYITHDLDFAVSKSESKILWIKNYDHEKTLWEWIELESNEVIPEDLYLEVLGSRQPILFVEGKKRSLDTRLYQILYNNYTIIPCESCKKVIQYVMALEKNKNLHGKKVYGLIDKDFRPDKDLTKFEENNIFNTKVNKVENLFLLPEIIELICNYMKQKDKKDEIITKIKNIYKKNKNQISSDALYFQRRNVMNRKFDSCKKEYQDFKKTIFDELDNVSVSLPDSNADVVSILEYYPHKGLINEVQGVVGLKDDAYENLVIEMLKNEKKTEITNIFKKYLPDLK